jgi:hypothetical protein
MTTPAPHAPRGQHARTPVCGAWRAVPQGGGAAPAGARDHHHQRCVRMLRCCPAGAVWHSHHLGSTRAKTWRTPPHDTHTHTHTHTHAHTTHTMHGAADPGLPPPSPPHTVGNPHQLGAKPITFTRQVSERRVVCTWVSACACVCVRGVPLSTCSPSCACVRMLNVLPANMSWPWTDHHHHHHHHHPTLAPPHTQ